MCSSWESLVATFALVAVYATGCNTVPAEKFQACQRELQAGQEEIQRIEKQLSEEQETSRSLRSQLAKARGIDQSFMDALVTPVKIELERMSGGYDNDGQFGDDGIVVYVQPIDRDGHVIKVAGSLKVTLLDLTNPPDRREIAVYQFDEPTLRSKWYGRLMTHHFTIHCPWPAGKRPMHNKITAHVVFTDKLTSRSLTAQGIYKVTFSPEGVAASAKPIK